MEVLVADARAHFEVLAPAFFVAQGGAPNIILEIANGGAEALPRRRPIGDARTAGRAIEGFGRAIAAADGGPGQRG